MIDLAATLIAISRDSGLMAEQDFDWIDCVGGGSDNYGRVRSKPLLVLPATIPRS